MNVRVKDFYFFVLDFILDRIDFLKYSDKGSIGDVNFVRVENFLLFLEEEKIYRESLRIILVRDMVVFFNKFIWMKMCILDYILYEFVEEMLQKFIFFFMLIFLKNEILYFDCIDILILYINQLEDWYI